MEWGSRQVAPRSDERPTASDSVVVWDGWVRGVHWSIAILFGVSWYTHRANLEWHRYAGYALLTLVLFRIYWGFAGSTTARFAHFVKGPAAIFRYGRALLGREHSAPVGHNPIGAISVLLLLALLLAQCLLGLFVTDLDGLESGPLSSLISFDTSRLLAAWHARLFTALQVLVALHVVAVLFYLFAKRDNLLAPMVTGRKRFVEAVEPLRIGRWWHGATALVFIAVTVWATIRNG